jgi:hypothetical protein
MPEKFELSLLGGAVERRYRKLRPETERIAWHKLESAQLTRAHLQQRAAVAIEKLRSRIVEPLMARGLLSTSFK